MLKTIIKSICIVALLFISSVLGPEIHESYLVQVKGRSVVKLGNPKKGSGTGFQIEYGGKQFILTNRHVCDLGNRFLHAQTYKGQAIVEVIKKSKKYDLCIVSEIEGLPSLSLSEGRSIQQKVYTIGHPLGLGKTIVDGRIIERINVTVQVDCNLDLENKRMEKVNSFFGPLEICVADYLSLRLSNVTFPGNSGSPVLNIIGNVVGVIFAGTNGIENLGYMVPLYQVKDFLESK
jgi:serine protease Do